MFRGFIIILSLLYTVQTRSAGDGAKKNDDTLKSSNPQDSRVESGVCILNIDGALQYPPILADLSGSFLLPEGDDISRNIPVPQGEVMQVSCPGSSFGFDNIWEDGPVYARCIEDSSFDVWTPDTEGEDRVFWEDMSCKSQPRDNTEILGSCGPSEENTLIRIGFQIADNQTTPTFTVCFDQTISRTLWVKHTLWDEISAQDHGNSRPDFQKDSFYDYDVDHAYSRNAQREEISKLVGSQELAEQYIEESGNLFLARGHLAPNADFIFFSWMDSSFHFINVAPQWQTFNGLNWNSLENTVRNFIISRTFDAEIYTGTHGILELADVKGDMVDIYIYDGNRLPVPKFYWKIVLDPLQETGVAVIGVNNPHLTELPASYILCPPLDNPTILEGVKEPENLYKGYIYACRVEELAKVVEEIPSLPKVDLLQ
ncbi:uncharacterized protein LOC111696065 [Eurytemora carolleeae]|uniref:uncharacterized protein LOC111696065 n=1 Tax=Eurytemora carolleeae TaxID=1294199 RepID=UPI000C75DE19|nr:uncharacterized protein LOC111696065 [Eurytemora carolleeae]|eukprot:XP_023321392.1 uncharacterized protein LOC111696065 [Eurytemora affinis]